MAVLQQSKNTALPISNSNSKIENNALSAPRKRTTTYDLGISVWINRHFGYRRVNIS